VVSPGTVLLTGPTGGLGRPAVLAMARRPADARPDLVLVGRPGAGLEGIADEARAAGATVHAVGADLARLADVRAAATRVRELLAAGAVAPLRAIVANAGISVADTRGASADGYERTFAVNHLAHAQLIGDLLDALTPPARIMLLGSNTYYLNTVRRILSVPPADWRDPVELATPAPSGVEPTMRAGGVAYSNSKLAILYYAHELQRRVPDGVGVTVFEPGFMPGTSLGREHGAAMMRVGRALQRVPGISSPVRSGPLLASVALDARWAHLRDGAFVVKDRERAVEPFAVDRAREERLWAATAELLQRAR
jgi:NAD(P)-dependent dehydrogenase (short-subunit alcohol dehydrogenase family)